MKIFIGNSVKNIAAFKAFIFSVVFLILTLSAQNGFANVYNVTNTTDGHALNQLRGAIEDADLAGGTHTINVAAGTYLLTLGQITFGNTAQNITITGAGPLITVISMTTGAGKDRIFFINPSGTTNSPVISVSGIKFQNGSLTSDPYGGAAICAGGGSGESLTVSNCEFINNIVPADSYGGGAICMQVRGNLFIDNCTFTNNISNDADGGAVLFITFNSALGDGFGIMNVTNSTFTGNSVIFPGAPTSNGGAIAFSGQAGVTTCNATINNNTFINNTADGLGGAIVVNNSPNLSIPQIHFNRFYNNTSAASSLSSGLHFVESSGSVNAENNWWGCNSNPVGASSTSPCNQAGGDVAGGGSLDANPWLQLKTTVSTNPICNNTLGLGNTTTVTTSILNNSDGTAVGLANLNLLIGLPVTWSAALGTLSGEQTTIQSSGLATATFTSNGTGGTATVNAQIDNVPSIETTPARASITVNAVPTPTITPGSSTTFCVGGSVNLSSSAASGNQWYLNGGALGGEVNQTYSTNSSGEYTVIVSSGGCVSSTSAGTVVTVNVPTSSETTVSICNKYTWNGTEYKESGDYVFQTTNVKGCDSTATLHLTILSVTSNTSKTDATCFGTGTGSITVTPTFGVSPFTYRIGTVGSYVSSNTFNNLRAGKYRVSILDVNGCAGVSSQMVITQPVAITGTASITNATCYGLTNGTITVTPSTGVAPYMYRLGDVGAYVNSNIFNNVKPDAYRVYIQDANSCVGKIVVNVTQPTKVSGTSTKTDESCPGAKNGTITVNGSGGTLPYSYRFGGSGSFTPTNTFTNLKAGSYRVYVNDANGCSGFSILTTVGQASGSCFSNMAKGIRNPNEATITTLSLSLSPNPATNYFTLGVRSVKQESVQVRVIDINGKTIYATKGLPEQTYRFGQSFAPGMYMIEVRQGDEVKTVKAVKIN